MTDLVESTTLRADSLQDLGIRWRRSSCVKFDIFIFTSRDRRTPYQMFTFRQCICSNKLFYLIYGSFFDVLCTNNTTNIVFETVQEKNLPLRNYRLFLLQQFNIIYLMVLRSLSNNRVQICIQDRNVMLLGSLDYFWCGDPENCNGEKVAWL